MAEIRRIKVPAEAVTVIKIESGIEIQTSPGHFAGRIIKFAKRKGRQIVVRLDGDPPTTRFVFKNSREYEACLDRQLSPPA